MGYVEAVLEVVRRIPAGRVMTYGLVAEVVAEELAARGERARGGARTVGQVMARHGAQVPWWRVVDARGRVVPSHRERALELLRAEGVPLTEDGSVRVREVVWWP